MSEKIKIPELLSPAGNMESLDAALYYGADAVYLGGESFGMRSAPKNFSVPEIGEAVKKAHKVGTRVYLTCNILPRNDQVKLLPAFLEQVSSCGVDALIISDLGTLSLAKQYAPRTDIHISTQLGVTNYQTALMLAELGAGRIVLARELSLEEIAEIRHNLPADVQIECFVHGAMCVSISGRCLLSAYLTGREADNGDCAQPCRWKYSVVEGKRPGIYIPVNEDEDGTHLFNSKDLCMIEHLDDLIAAGVDSLKIEGRAKNAYYTSVVTNAYRSALDILAKGESVEATAPWIKEELNKISHREYCTGFYYSKPSQAQVYYEGGYLQEWDLAAVVESYEKPTALVIQRNRFFNGEYLETFEPGKPPFGFKVQNLRDENHIKIDSAPHPLQKVYFDCDIPLKEGAILRRKVN